MNDVLVSTMFCIVLTCKSKCIKVELLLNCTIHATKIIQLAYILNAPAICRGGITLRPAIILLFLLRLTS